MSLKGLRVVDLSRILAGPFATMILGDMGADVVKIERPGGGDDSRGWGPPFADGTSTYFLSVNRNKRSVTLDLGRSAGKQLLWEMIEQADVLVSNFRAGLMDRFGFSYEEVARRAPRCIYGLISGYGAQGPRAAKPSFDVVIQAETGLMDLTGFPEGQPTKVGISLADQIAGLYLVQGILLALLERQRSGAGQLVEVALHDAMLSMFTFQAQGYLTAGRSPQRLGNRHPSIVPYETFETGDGMIVVGVANEAIWERFCAAVAPQLREHPDFACNADRVANRAALDDLLRPVFRRHTVAEWEEILAAAGVPCGKVRALNEVLDAERGAGRGMIIEADGFTSLGVPVKLSASPGSIRARPPRLGEHTAAVLTELGHTEEELAVWRAAGVI